MNTKELLQLQALRLKRDVLRDNPDFDHAQDAPAWMRDTYDTSTENRNLCGQIPVSLFDELERLSGVLKISKRAMLEMSLRDFAKDANKALDDVGFVASSVSCRSVGTVPADEA